MVDTFVARGLLRDGLDPDEATDVLLTLVDSDTFLNFTQGRGWPVRRRVGWTTDTLAAVLLSPANARRR